MRWKPEMLPSCVSPIAVRLAFQEEELSHVVLDPSNRWASDRRTSFLGREKTSQDSRLWCREHFNKQARSDAISGSEYSLSTKRH